MTSRSAGVVCGLAVLCCAMAYAGQSGIQTRASLHQQQTEIRDLRAGERYPGGTRVQSPFLGISFVVPKEWRASLPAGSVVFLDSAVKPGLGVIHLLSDVSREDVVTKLNDPQSFEAGFLLHPTGSIREEGSRLVANHAAGDDVGVTVALLGPSRNAVVYQFVGRKTEQELYQRFVEELVASTQFTTESDTRALHTWYERLTGIMLTPQIDSAIAQSMGLTAIHLCSDGRFIRTIRLQPVPGRPADGEDGGAYHETGTWRLEVQGAKAGLVLTTSTGGGDTHDLQSKNDQVLLDGQPASVTVSNSCP